MFDGFPDVSHAGAADPAALVTAIRESHRAEAACAARKWTAMALLLGYREAAAAAEEQLWSHDTWAAVTNEVGAAMGLTSRRASGQLRIAEALAGRLPQVASLLAHGVITARTVATIVYRTELVATAAQGAVDAALAERAGGFGVLSEEEVQLAIDAVVEELDPDACRRYREVAKTCDVQFGKPEDATGTASLFGRVSAVDADLAARVLDAVADTVCRADPRTKRERRVAAFGAVFNFRDRLDCQCGKADCAAGTRSSGVGKVVIHILAEQGSVDQALTEAAAYEQQQRAQRAQREEREEREERAQQPPEAEDEPAPTPTDDGEPDWATWRSTPTVQQDAPADASSDEADTVAAPGDHALGDTASDESGSGDTAAPQRRTADCRVPRPEPEPEPEPESQSEPTAVTPAEPTTPGTPVRPAVTLSGKIIPSPLLAALIRTGATLQPLTTPPQEPEPRYRPSRTLRQFVWCRDMFCRFPGCNRRADHADIDHTIPDTIGGPTHPSNTKTLCREHHLAKTFRGGPHGWRDEQLPDGGIIWTAPTGHDYLTEPTSILIFPDLDTTTATLPPPPKPKPKPKPKKREHTPGLTMPKRTRTRAQDREQHTKTEREYNATQRALEKSRRSRPPPAQEHE
jgi:hypothetical protein